MTLLTLGEVALRLRVSRRTVERLIAAGRIRPYRISPTGKRGRVLVSEKEVEAYVASLRRAA